MKEHLIPGVSLTVALLAIGEQQQAACYVSLEAMDEVRTRGRARPNPLLNQLASLVEDTRLAFPLVRADINAVHGWLLASSPPTPLGG